MLKYLALSLIFLACAGTGAGLARGYSLRARELEKCVQMLANLRAQLQFSRPPVDRMLGSLCGLENSPAFLSQCVAGMRGGEAFPQAWRGCVEQAPHLRGEDRRQLAALGDLLGAGDAAGQRETLLVQEELLGARLDQARAQRDARAKTCFTLGVLAGLAMMILFL